MYSFAASFSLLYAPGTSLFIKKKTQRTMSCLLARDVSNQTLRNIMRPSLKKNADGWKEHCMRSVVRPLKGEKISIRRSIRESLRGQEKRALSFQAQQMHHTLPFTNAAISHNYIKRNFIKKADVLHNLHYPTRPLPISLPCHHPPNENEIGKRINICTSYLMRQPRLPHKRHIPSAHLHSHPFPFHAECHIEPIRDSDVQARKKNK